MRKVRVGVIGFGPWAQNHARFYRESAGAELVAVAAPSEESRRRAVEAFGVEAYGDYRDLLARGDIEAVSIATPNYLHAGQAVAALRAGKHVLVEKPMALSTRDCEEMIRAAGEEGRRLAVGYELRLSPMMEGIRGLIDAGGLGELRSVSIGAWRPPWRAGSGGWRLRRELSGGLLFEEPCHYFDLLAWFLGGAEEVYAVASRCTEAFDFEDTVFACSRHAGGGVGSVSFSIAGFGYRFSIEMTGTGGSVRGHVEGGHFLWSPEARETRLFHMPRGGEAREVEMKGKIGELFDLQREIELWIRCVREGGQPPVPGDEGMKSVALCEAAERSIRTGRPVRLAPHTRRKA